MSPSAQVRRDQHSIPPSDGTLHRPRIISFKVKRIEGKRAKAFHMIPTTKVWHPSKSRIGDISFSSQRQALSDGLDSEDRTVFTPLREPAKAKRKQGASVEMAEFLKNEGKLLDLMFERDSEANLFDDCACGNGEAIFRCQECLNVGLFCRQCICDMHVHNPFHWVQRWHNNYFQPIGLGDLGLVVNLGHGGIRCTNIAPGTPTLRVTVVHHNGIHKAQFAWCECGKHNADHVEQLMRAGLFPATLAQPRTVFTFQMLNEAHVHILQSKKSAYDYILSIRRLTNNVFTSEVPDRYNAYLRVSRVWSYLKSLRRSGHHHGLQCDLPHLPRGSLALTCPACPQEGFNMRRDDAAVPDHLRDLSTPDYVDTLFIGADGNFHARRKNKISKTDPDDVSLCGGRRIFVEDTEYNSYVHTVESDPAYQEEKPPATCSGFRAGDASRAVKDKGLAVTGVIAVVCARHGIFRPSGMVNMAVGERYHLVDYAIAKACESVTNLKIVLTYDVSCRHDKNIRTRFDRWLPGFKRIVDSMTEKVPKMHILAHKADCQYRYALDYEDGVGMTHGETVEHPWAEGNQTGSSTQEMNAGHRLDALDDFNSFWCWSKIQRLPDYLCRRLIEELEVLTRLQAEFKARTMVIDKVLLQKWSEEIGREPWKDDDDEWNSIFRQKLGKAPTRKDILSELSQLEKKSNSLPDISDVNHLDGTYTTFKGTAAFINSGISIRLKQWEVKRRIAQWREKFPILTEDDERRHSEKLETSRAGLQSDIQSWRAKQSIFLPLVDATYISTPDADDERPEEAILGLPSDIDKTYHAQLELEDLANLELKLWQGLAFDTLSILKEQIKHKKTFLGEKKKSVYGQHALTRANATLTSATQHIERTAERYNFVRSCMIGAGLPSTCRQFRELLKTQLWVADVNSSVTKSTTKSKRRQPSGNDGRNKDKVQEEAWFWKTEMPPNISKEDQKAWSMEVDRVRWHRQRAECDRHSEEVEILKEELRRVMRTHNNFSQLWRSRIVDNPTSKLELGKNAYAIRTSVMYEGLRTRAEIAFKKAVDPEFRMRLKNKKGTDEN